MITFGTPYNMEIPSQEHLLSTWLMVHRSKWLVWYTDGVSPVAAICGVRICVHATGYPAEILVNLACANECT
jgi:D-mannonate dehydratase